MLTFRRFFAIMAAAIFIPQFLLAVGFLNPRIQNYGSYKPIFSHEEAKLRPLFGHVPPDVRHANKVAPVDGSEILKLSIVFPFNNEEELHEVLLDITNPTSENYRQFLNQDDFIEKYGPTLEQLDLVATYFYDRGLYLEGIEPNRLIIKVAGSISAINDIFHTEIYRYEDEKGEQFYAPAYEIQVDASLPIVSVLGLENRLKLKSHLQRRNSKLISERPESQIAGLTPAGIQQAYSFPTNLNGSGQTLALFELDGFTASDITAYETMFGLPNVPLQVVLVDGASGSPGPGANEVTVDIELMIASAPGATKIIVYEGPNTAQGVVDTYNRIATDNLAKVISTSWGIAETFASGSFLQSENLIFMQMAAQGQALFAASGDNGAYDNGSTLSVDDPSSQPFVVGVGGTHLNLDGSGNYVSETTWSSGNGPGQGGGGGISSVWSIPSWQVGVANSNNFGSTTMRNVPDVALDADPATGYAIYFNGQWLVFGGTSSAAPIWAGLAALVNQQRANNLQGVLGFPNPLIYQGGFSSNYHSLIHDVTSGTNGFYPAVAGYDLATGWGSPIAGALITYLASQNPPPVCTRANPTVTLAPSTQSGTPGQQLTYTVTVTNHDSSACGPSVFNLSAGVPSGFTDSFGQSGLNIQPGQNGSTNISVTSPTNASPGTYTFSVTAVNGSAGTYMGSASANYVVLQTLTMTISPQNPSYTKNQTAQFTMTLKLGSTPVANNPVTISVTGPKSFNASGSTNANGIFIYSFKISSSYPNGTYTFAASSTYQNQTANASTNFTVH